MTTARRGAGRNLICEISNRSFGFRRPRQFWVASAHLLGWAVSGCGAVLISCFVWLRQSDQPCVLWSGFFSLGSITPPLLQPPSPTHLQHYLLKVHPWEAPDSITDSQVGTSVIIGPSNSCSISASWALSSVHPQNPVTSFYINYPHFTE